VPLVEGIYVTAEPGAIAVSSAEGSAAAAILKCPLRLIGIEPPERALEIASVAGEADGPDPPSPFPMREGGDP
jgi:hypothetical protein